VFAPFLGVLWCFQRLFVKAPSGRQRLNVLAALNAVSQELVTVSNLTYVNAETVCELLRRLAASHLGTPITVVLDNARYQRCKLVEELARQLDIELLFLPSYSPNLNLIERFWKFVKKQCLYSTYYPDAASFQQAILSCIAEAPSKHKAELASLLSLKFQTFKEVPIVPQPQPLALAPTVQQPSEKPLSMAA
jgi:transposase